ncbi:hypothetical protein EJ08DRAFT_163432 [Tothia fuscella]|uniref:EKC/KEOPS complex subunit GON7 n=1 Tax=Tothia fuscella TaxID=1048955 RepID=A0A9P4NVS2_9PEZI|nr:hypothetical protein EJ08DRAFT_163432 [Tothia fuscella]
MPPTPALVASYSAPCSDSTEFHQPLPTCSKDPSTEERTASLAALREAITNTQDQINDFLTKKMEEDNAKAGVAAVDDAKAEEAYGEEDAEEEA